MSYLLDTNVVSETIRAMPHPAVIRWLKATDNEDIYVSVLTLGEIRKGIEKLAPSDKRQKIVQWLEHDFRAWFQDRILLIDEDVVDRWGILMAQHCVSLPAIDSLIAATALVKGLTIVTRNVKDFQIQGLDLFNPFSS